MIPGKRERTCQRAADRAKRVVLCVLSGQEINHIAQMHDLHVNHAYRAWRRWLADNHPDVLAATLHRPRKGRIAWSRERVLAKQIAHAAPIPPIVIIRP